MKRVIIGDFNCENSIGIEDVELETGRIVCAWLGGCRVLVRVPGNLALFVVFNCGRK